MSIEFEGRQRALLESRPRPLADAASTVSKIVGTAGTLVAVTVGWGLLTAVQGDAVVGLLGAVPGVVTLVTSVLSAFGVVRRAEPSVTPVSDPRDDRLRPLVALESGGPARRA